MATIKSYTDIKQSKKLAEILNKQTADMWYQYIGASYEKGSEKPLYFPMIIRDSKTEDDIPCWSLAALLNVLPNGTDVVKEEADTENEKYMCTVLVKDSLVITFANNLVDVCVEMILKLHEQKLL